MEVREGDHNVHLVPHRLDFFGCGLEVVLVCNSPHVIGVSVHCASVVGEADDAETPACCSHYDAGNQVFGAMPLVIGVGRQEWESRKVCVALHHVLGEVEVVVAYGHSIVAHVVHDLYDWSALEKVCHVGVVRRIAHIQQDDVGIARLEIPYESSHSGHSADGILGCARRVGLEVAMDIRSDEDCDRSEFAPARNLLYQLSSLHSAYGAVTPVGSVYGESRLELGVAVDARVNAEHDASQGLNECGTRHGLIGPETPISLVDSTHLV